MNNEESARDANCKMSSFVDEVRYYCSIFKKNRSDQDDLKTVSIHDLADKVEASKTRSKSRKKRKGNSSKSNKKSKRRTSGLEQQQLLEIDKEPIWNKRKYEPSKRRKSQIVLQPVPASMPKVPKCDPHNQLYQFYSNDESPALEKDHSPRATFKRNQKDRKSSASESSFISDEQIDEWEPQKMEMSLLSIQKIIDQYFIFKSEFRANQLAVSTESVIKYVRDIQGYYFDRKMLQRLLILNPKLYTISFHKEEIMKCRKLTQEQVEARVRRTKEKMKRNFSRFE